MKAIAHPSALGVWRSHASPHFRDRVDAGIQLGTRLAAYHRRHVLVLGILRGGVPVAAEVSRELAGELNVVVARKLHSPISDELAIGAVTGDGVRYLNAAMLRFLGVDDRYVARATQVAWADAAQLEARFRRGQPAPAIAGREVILVDDGLATGATMIAAARSVRVHGPTRLVIAVPVGSSEACAMLKHEADNVVCLATPEPFWSVGACYDNFEPPEDDDVERLLRGTPWPQAAPPSPAATA
jgi:predicted phosphoribosyltransferase